MTEKKNTHKKFPFSMKRFENSEKLSAWPLAVLVGFFFSQIYVNARQHEVNKNKTKQKKTNQQMLERLLCCILLFFVFVQSLRKY